MGKLYGDIVVEQADWDFPRRGDWIAGWKTSSSPSPARSPRRP
jgi:hypothetical protein